MQPYLTVPNLGLRDRLLHGFTTKELGADRQKIAASLKIQQDSIVSLEQVHSATVVCIDDKTDLRALPQGDALVTNRTGIVIGVKTADCLPILAYDHKKRVVAAIHAGWRGLADGIVKKTLDVLFHRYACRLENLEFAFGPCISDAVYEVGDEVIAAFRENFGTRFSFRQKSGQKPHLDLIGTARMSLEDIGFYHRNLSEVGLCTFEREDLFHSYRRAPGQGRQFNFIGLA